MNTKSWQEVFPEVYELLADNVEKLEPEDHAYVRGMLQAWELYGKEGVSVQLLYISNNLKRGSKPLEKELVRHSKRIDKELREESRSGS